MSNIIVKGKSEKNPFTVTIPQEELFEVFSYVVAKSTEEYDPETATSPGGLPTALFTCIFPAKAREEVGWILTEGWSMDKAKAAFDVRLERKQGAGGFSLETRQKTWDDKAATLRGLNVPEAVIIQSLGKRPEAKAQVVKQGLEELKAAGIV